MRPYNMYDAVVMHTIEHDGGTFLLGKDNMNPMSSQAKVWVLSLDDARGIVMPVDDFNATTLTVWCLNGNEDYIRQWNSRRTHYGTLKCIGTWIDDGKVYVDVATIINKDEMSLDTVLELARANKQIAIWDNEKQVAVESGLR